MKKSRAQWKKGVFAIAGSFVFGLARFAHAQEFPEIAAAAKPIEDGVPDVAAQRLKALLANNLPTEERAIAASKLAEALVLAGQPAKALKLFEPPESLRGVSADFWHAQALAALGHWEEALAIYQKMAAGTSMLRFDALFGATEALRALDRGEEALRALVPLLQDALWSVRAKLRSADILLDRKDVQGANRFLRETQPQSLTERKEKHFLNGRLRAQQNQLDKAIDNYSSILKDVEGVPHPLLIATLFAIADAHLQRQTPGEGDDVLEDFIDHHPNDPELPAIFAKLDELYRAERKPSRNTLSRWLREKEQPRRALAQWYFARSEGRAGRHDVMTQMLGEVRASGVKLPALAEALLELAQLQLESRQWDDALVTLQSARAQNPEPQLLERINWLTAQAEYHAGRFAKAAPIFEQIAQTSPAFASPAFFNAALCWLRVDNAAEQFSADYKKINDGASGKSTQGDLLLEEGFVRAAQGDKRAAESLQTFIRQFPQSPRVAEAWIALAELAFHAAPPDLKAVRKDLEHARQSPSNAAATERAAYLAIWMEDAAQPSDAAKVIALADHFLQQHPNSAFSAEVRMKLAEAYFRRQDFANAQTQFELLAQENPKDLFVEKALFFAAESAMSSMGAQSLDHALALLTQVVAMNGEMKWAARNEQALVERKLGKDQDALLLYDEVLKNNARPAEKREALCGKGDIYYEMAANDPEKYKRALELFEQLAAEPGGSAHWRNQALFKKGKCLEKLNDTNGALASYYSVIEEGGRPDLHEFFWFYKAGFNAAHLLEEQNKWQPAAAVYQKLAAVSGTRSEEAKARLTQLRLEHFLWED